MKPFFPQGSFPKIPRSLHARTFKWESRSTTGFLFLRGSRTHISGRRNDFSFLFLFLELKIKKYYKIFSTEYCRHSSKCGLRVFKNFFPFTYLRRTSPSDNFSEDDKFSPTPSQDRHSNSVQLKGIPLKHLHL